MITSVKTTKVLLLALVAVIATYFRVVGLNWDEGTGLHPDERFLNMTQSSIGWGVPWSLYFDTANSPLNPLNRGTSFFVYGTLPLFIVKGLMELVRPWQIHELHMIGRWVSVFFDIITVVAAAATARLLAGYWGAVVTGILAASCVGLVQQAHFGTVDSVATSFATLTLWALVRLSMVGRWESWRAIRWSVLVGILAGCAAASKAPCGLVIGLLPIALLIRARAIPVFLINGLVGGFAVFLTFRIAHPYAFEGPGFFGVTLSARWLANLQEQLHLGRASLGYPPAVQWVERDGWFAIENMFRWGVGELGTLLIATALIFGSAVAVRRREWRVLMVAAWGVLIFTYLAILSPNRYLRYQIPAYPAFFVVVGWFVVEAARGWSNSARRVVLLFAVFALAQTVIWCFAFTRIYTREHPRVAASRWLYSNLPTGVSAKVAVNNSQKLAPLITSKSLTLLPGVPSRVPLSSPKNIYAKGFQFNFFDQPLEASATLSITFPALGETIRSAPGQTEINFSNPLRLEAGRQHLVTVTLDNSSIPMQLRRVRIAHETPWDDSLPIRMDGYDPFGGLYEAGSTLELFFRDSESKRDLIVRALQDSDYFVITSQRVWGSVGRLANYYPMTQEFYRALIGCPEDRLLAECFKTLSVDNSQGKIGYELIKSFESHPNLGSYQIRDEDADESFSVYDHPRVFIFKKTPAFSAEKLQQLLSSKIPAPGSLPPDP